MTGRLSGRRILVVEDEYYIASDIRRALAGENAIVIGPVGSLDQALALADAERLDAAVLDVNLGTAQAYAVADRLRAANTPWLFVTGYDGWSMPAAYRDTPRLAKPLAMESVIDAVAAMMTDAAA